ncbi:MAG: S8 family peptidase, partial [Chloroflexota bacterium]
DLDHPDLNAKILTHLGWNFIADDANVDDDHGHGTHVAGIAAAATDNEIGIAGVGWNATILPLKALDSAGQGYFLDVAEAITYAAAKGVDVINLSLGPKTDVRMSCPEYLQDAVDDASEANVTLVAAAGNNGERDDGEWIEIPPANCRHVIGVAATRNDDTLPVYSSPGSHVSTAAPGGDRGDATSAIYSTLMGGQYGSLFGTSMATPHVAGLAALLLARYPTYSPDQIASAILDNAVDLGDPGWDEYYGCGRIDAAQALSAGAHAAEPLCLEGATSSALSPQQPAPDAAFAPGEIIVHYQPGTVVPAPSRAYAARAEHLPSLDLWLLRVPVGQERAVLARIRADPDVLYADLNYRVFAQ